MNTMSVDDSQNGYSQLDGKSSQYSVYLHQLRRSPLKVATVCLGLLSVLLLAVIIGQRVHFNNVEKSQQDKYNAMTQNRDTLQESLNTANKDSKLIQDARDRLQTNYRTLSTSKDLLQTTNYALTAERDTLKSSQTQLQSSNAALTRANEQLKARRDQLQTDKDTLTRGKDQLQQLYQGVIAERNQYRNGQNSVTKDRDQLQNKYNNLTRSREQLQKNCNDMVKEFEQLQISHNFSTSEKEEIQKSHMNLTKDMIQLKDNYKSLVVSRDQLQESYNTLMTERDQLQISRNNITEERDQLKANYYNLTQDSEELQANCNITTAERDQLAARLNATIAGTCPHNWKKFDDSCYFTSIIKKSWSSSRTECQKEGGDLVIINTEGERAFINGLYRSSEEAWIGLYYTRSRGIWKWVDNSLMTTTYWMDGQPNDYNGQQQDCVQFQHRSSDSKHWNDMVCNESALWICEVSLTTYNKIRPRPAMASV